MAAIQEVTLNLATADFDEQVEHVKSALGELRELGLETMQVLRLRPGDVLVVKLTELVSAQVLSDVKKTLESHFPEQRVLVTQSVQSIEVLRPGEDGMSA